jgi:NAD+ diphosphatase
MLRTPASFEPLLDLDAADDDLNFVFRRDALLLADADLALPCSSQLPALALPPPMAALTLGRWQGRGLRSHVHDDPDMPAPAGHHWRKLRATFGVLSDELAALAGRAFQLTEWARTHRYCGACGNATQLLQGERCARCPRCGHSAYPRISPAMMVLVRRGDALLLARHAGRPGSFFTALAGFLEAGESIEEAVHREVYEEVGLYVDGLRYVASQSWPFPHSLMIAFTAEYAGGVLRPDESEIAEARWFGPDDPAPNIPPPISIASHLIRSHAPPCWGYARP